MIRPDLVPSGSAENKQYFAINLGGITIHNYSDVKSLQLRLLLLKYNQLYGSLFELHISKKNSVKIQYFDILFLNCFAKYAGNNIGKLKFVFDYIIKPWYYLDKGVAKFFKAMFWRQLSNFLEKYVFPNRKSHWRR
jgi:hypothetical protein